MPTDLIAALVQAQQQRAGRRLNHSNAEPPSTPAPAVKLKESNAFTDTIELADQAAVVSKRIALLEQQKNSASQQNTSIRLYVGKGEDGKQFEADANALRAYSTYFHRHLPRTSFPGELELPHEDPAAFAIFIGWCKKPKQPTKYRSGQYTGEPWISQAVAAWMLGNRLGAQRYEIYALSQFIQNCAVMLDGPWKYIEDNVPNTSALSRFSNHWVAWNAYYCGGGTNEYSGLFAARLACEVKPSTRDPRIFDLHHWYSGCGNSMNPTCEHDPILKEQERQAELRRNRPAPEEWGAELEISSS